MVSGIRTAKSRGTGRVKSVPRVEEEKWDNSSSIGSCRLNFSSVEGVIYLITS